MIILDEYMIALQFALVKRSRYGCGIRAHLRNNAGVKSREEKRRC